MPLSVSPYVFLMVVGFRSNFDLAGVIEYSGEMSLSLMLAANLEPTPAKLCVGFEDRTSTRYSR